MPTIIFMILTRSDLFTFVKKCTIRLAKHLSKMTIVDHFRFENTFFVFMFILKIDALNFCSLDLSYLNVPIL